MEHIKYICDPMSNKTETPNIYMNMQIPSPKETDIVEVGR